MNTNNLYINVLSCGSSRPDAHTEYHRRISKTMEHHKLLFVARGKGKLIVGDKRYYLKKGTLIYHSPDTPTEVDLYAEEPLIFLSVLFDYIGVVLCDGTYRLDDEVASLPFLPVQDLTDFYPLEAVFEKLILTWNAKLPGYEFISKTLLQELFIIISQSRDHQSPNYAASLKVEKIIQYMREQIGQKSDLAELAGLAQLSTFHLSKIFKEKTGYSIMEYYNKIKIDQAKVMLMEGNKKVKEVAHTLGFSDEFYFSRIFKKYERISPSEYHNKNVHGI